MPCVPRAGSVPEEILLLILSALLCAGQPPGKDRTAKRCSVLSPPARGRDPAWSPDLPFGTAPSVPTPKARRALFDPAVGAVASLLLQPFSHPSFSLIRASVRGSGKLLSWAEEEPAVGCPGRGKGFHPAAGSSEPPAAGKAALRFWGGWEGEVGPCYPSLPKGSSQSRVAY